jgi:hypothetical protein
VTADKAVDGWSNPTRSLRTKFCRHVGHLVNVGRRRLVGLGVTRPAKSGTPTTRSGWPWGRTQLQPKFIARCWSTKGGQRVERLRLRIGAGLLLILILMGACVPSVRTGSGGESGYNQSIVTGAVWVYPNGNLFTKGQALTSDANFLVGSTDSPIQITYRVDSYTVPGNNFWAPHDYDTTKWLRTGSTYQHYGDYKVYTHAGNFEMRGRALACLYNDGGPCFIGLNNADSQFFEIIDGF